MSFENLEVDQYYNLYLISLSFLITCLQDNVWILCEEVACWSILGDKGLRCHKQEINVMLNFTAIDRVLNCFNSAELYFYFQNLLFFCYQLLLFLTTLLHVMFMQDNMSNRNKVADLFILQLSEYLYYFDIN